MCDVSDVRHTLFPPNFHQVPHQPLRPPNPFILFRADFLRQKHVFESIEANYGLLSKIIDSSVFLSSSYLIASHSHLTPSIHLGNCWRALPLEEKRAWEVLAKHAKTDHKIQYPRICEEVAQLLLEGKKGEELAAAVRDLNSRSSAREETPAGLFVHQQRQQQQHLHGRSSSVPLPNHCYPAFSVITLPSVPFLPTSRAPSPVNSISRHLHQAARYNHLGHRRSSSVGAIFSPSSPSISIIDNANASPPALPPTRPLPTSRS